MPRKDFTTFDSRLSNIFTVRLLPHETNKFPLLGQTSIRKATSKRTKIKLTKKKQEI